MNNYLLSYNPYGFTPTEGQLLNHVKVNRFIVQYYQPFIGTYVLKSEQTAVVVTESLKGLFEQSPFMVTQLFSHLTGGTMPQEIWHWINHGYMPAPPPQAPPPPHENFLGGLLGALKKDGN
ncbi:MAG: hypothetical protein DI606_16350 [Sphingobium sp.]|uniref:hypothetical protein n=1 Tax=Sphingobium sp. TaxID=1912891 RepID=UPI000DB5B58D|nr:hypothetical protein [Sphingobium sp.]PZU07652.1 MAG: hypothetical protein DI606_16350 [Sphingobium sp.]